MKGKFTDALARCVPLNVGKLKSELSLGVYAFCIVGFEEGEKATESLGGLEFRGRGFVAESPLNK